MKNRPVRGKKNPSATTLARALVVGFLRFCSTAMRDEKVRTFKTEGPVSLSAKEAAIGDIIVFISVVERLSMAVSWGALCEAYNWCIFSGRLLDGKEVLDLGIGFSVANPPSSRAPRPRVMRIDARWEIE